MTRKDGESVAIAALGFLAGDDELMQRFLALSGISADSIRNAAAQPGFLAGVLSFITSHEPTLMAFSNHSGIEPEIIAAAGKTLPGGGGQEWISA